MAEEEPRILAAPKDVDEALSTPTVIDLHEFAEARLDERWREFCLDADTYVADATRPAGSRLTPIPPLKP